MDEDCEACGLLIWRMQTIVAAKAAALESKKKATEKRAAKATKAHSKRWLKQEYGVALASAIESEIDALQMDSKLIGSACRLGHEAMTGSALRGHQFDNKCESRVRRSVGELLEDLQDELVGSVTAGFGAGATCAKLLPQCTSARARLLLGPNYKDDMAWHELDRLQAGYSDEWTIHKDVDDSFYWFNKAQMKSQKEPPPGWAKDASGEWKKVPQDHQSESAEPPSIESPSIVAKDEV